MQKVDPAQRHFRVNFICLAKNHIMNFLTISFLDNQPTNFAHDLVHGDAFAFRLFGLVLIHGALHGIPHLLLQFRVLEVH